MCPSLELYFFTCVWGDYEVVRVVNGSYIKSSVVSCVSLSTTNTEKSKLLTLNFTGLISVVFLHKPLVIISPIICISVHECNGTSCSHSCTFCAFVKYWVKKYSIRSSARPTTTYVVQPHVDDHLKLMCIFIDN